MSTTSPKAVLQTTPGRTVSHLHSSRRLRSICLQAFRMAIANKINATAMSANRAKVCIYLLSPLALDLPFDAPQENPSLMLRPHLRVAAPLR